MTHDPLCKPIMQFGVEMCDCSLIARVRQDERTRWHHHEACRMSEPCPERNGVHDLSLDDQRCLDCDALCICGYAAALRDAVEAVKALPWHDHGFWSVNEPGATAVAAIEALGKGSSDE